MELFCWLSYWKLGGSFIDTPWNALLGRVESRALTPSFCDAESTGLSEKIDPEVRSPARRILGTVYSISQPHYDQQGGITQLKIS